MSPTHASFRARCIDGAGEPVRGATLWIEYDAGMDGVAEFASRPSGADGVVRLTASIDVQVEDVLVGVRARGMAFLECAIELGARDRVFDLGDVLLRRGVSVRGRITDHLGRVVPGQAVSLVKLDPAGPGSSDPTACSDLSRVVGRTDAEGRFEIDVEVVEGEWQVVLERHLGPPTVALRAPRADLALVVERADAARCVSGRVVDQGGQPVAGAKVTARALLDNRHVGDALTDTAGFYCMAARAGPLRAGVWITVDAQGYERGWAPRPAQWGSVVPDIAVQRGRTLELEVVRADTGEALDRYGVQLRSPVSHWAIESAASLASGAREGDGGRVTARPNGRCRIHGLSGTRLQGIVRPDRHSGLFPSAPQTWWLNDVGIQTRARVELYPSDAVSVQVTNTRGEPVPGVPCGLVQHLGMGSPAADRDFGRADDVSMWNATDQIVADGVTDARGRVTLLGPRGAPLSLCVWWSAAAAPVMVGGIVWGAEPFGVVVPVGAKVTGRWDPSAVPGSANDSVEGDATHALLVSQTDLVSGLTTRIDRDGRFEFEGVGPGDWGLELRFGGRSGWFRVGEVRSLRDGEHREIAVDPAAVELARVELALGSKRASAGAKRSARSEVRILDPAGLPVPGLDMLVWEPPDGGVSHRTTDGDGVLRVDAPGRYALRAVRQIYHHPAARARRQAEAPLADGDEVWLDAGVLDLADAVSGSATSWRLPAIWSER